MPFEALKVLQESKRNNIGTRDQNISSFCLPIMSMAALVGQKYNDISGVPEIQLYLTALATAL